MRVIFMLDVHDRHVDCFIINSGGRGAASQQTVRADARAAKREIQRRATTNNKSATDAKSSLIKSGATAKPVNRPKRVELVNFRGVLVPKEVEIRRSCAYFDQRRRRHHCSSKTQLIQKA